MMNTILLIEDNEDIRENTRELLEIANYQVLTAADGREGLSLMKEHKEKLSAILCDIMMPELDGYAVLKASENMPELKQVPFIFLTARSEKSDVRKGMDLGADDYLSKPFTNEELLNILSARLAKTRTQREGQKNDILRFEEFVNRSSALFSFEEFGAKYRTKKLKKKETLYTEGEESGIVYFVLAGRYKTVRTTDYGKDYMVNIYGPGDFLGYNSFLTGEEHMETAIATEDAEVALLQRGDFFEMLFTNKKVCARLIGYLSALLKETESRLPDVAYNSARKKVADALIFLAMKHELEAADQASIAVSRDDLSSLSGIAPESVSRNLTDFKNEGLIDISQSGITILNYRKLQTLKN